MVQYKQLTGHEYIERNRFKVKFEIHSSAKIVITSDVIEKLDLLSRHIDSVNILQENRFKDIHFIDMYFFRMADDTGLYNLLKLAFISHFFFDVTIDLFDKEYNVVSTHSFTSLIHDFLPFLSLSYNNENSFRLNSIRGKYSLDLENKEYYIKSKLRFLTPSRNLI